MSISKIQSSVFVVVALLAMMLLSFCTNEMTSYKKYVDDGEITYTGKPDSVQVYSGKNRVMIEGLLIADPKISEVHISWDGETDSVVVPINRTDGVDTMRTYIDDLEEKVYNFKVTTYNKSGDKSVPTYISGRVYGERYQSTLLNRPVASDEAGLNEVEVELGGIDNTGGALFSQIAFTHSNNENDTVSISVDESSIVLQDYKFGSDLEYRTLYKPEETAIDTFATSFKTYQPDFSLVPIEPEGSGTQADPYKIASAANLLWMSANTDEAYDKYFIQTADIDASLTSKRNYNGGQGLLPIGQGNNFSGSYDGQGYTISNLYINRPNTNDQAMFAAAVGATIENIHLVDAEISGRAFSGGLVPWHDGTITNCSVTGTITSGSRRRIGAIAGVNAGTVSNCYSNVTIEANGANQVGGLVGFSQGDITNSYAIATIRNGSNRIGGIAGRADAGTYENNYFVGTLESDDTSDRFGPIAGLIKGGTWTNNYYNSEVYGSTQDETGITGKTTSEMMMESTFNGFDFSGMWSIDEGNSYPYLQNNEQTPHPGTN